MADQCFQKMEELRFDYSLYKYEDLNRSIIQNIKTKLKNHCILIIAYENEISLMHFYKLGLAHAHGKYAIVLELKQSNNKLSSIPDCIGNTFFIRISLDGINKQNFGNRLIG